MPCFIHTCTNAYTRVYTWTTLKDIVAQDSSQYLYNSGSMAVFNELISSLRPTYVVVMSRVLKLWICYICMYIRQSSSKSPVRCTHASLLWTYRTGRWVVCDETMQPLWHRFMTSPCWDAGRHSAVMGCMDWQHLDIASTMVTYKSCYLVTCFQKALCEPML